MADDDKTVFGGKLPGATPPAADNDKTVIGGALPPAQPGGFARPAQPSGNTWLGGAVPQAPQTPIGEPATRGQGWSFEPAFGGCREPSDPVRSSAHRHG